jgi:hypothetical protein
VVAFLGLGSLMAISREGASTTSSGASAASTAASSGGSSGTSTSVDDPYDPYDDADTGLDPGSPSTGSSSDTQTHAS